MLLILVCMLLGTACATIETNQTDVMKRTQKLDVETILIQNGYEVFAVIEAQKPVAEHMYLLATSGNTELQIRDTSGFAQILHEIASQDDALEYIRLITHTDIMPFLQDVSYPMVHQKARAEDVWFAIDAEQYAALNLHDPLVTEKEDIYIIDRIAVCYPKLIHDTLLTPARLVSLREWVSSDGKYAVEIRQTIAEGDEVQKILPIIK
jgi:hypothetical protein